MIKFRPSIAFCVCLYSFFNSGFDIEVYIVYDPDMILVHFHTIMIFSLVVFTMFLIASKIRNGVQYTAVSKPRGIQGTRLSVAKK
jgi:hypothetical protein